MSLLKSATVVLASNILGVPAVGQIIPFSSASHDDVGAFNSGAPTRLTVPAGATRARITANATISGPETNTEYFINVLKNGNGLYDERPGQEGVANIGTAQVQLSAASPVLVVQEGDYFELNVRSNGTTAFDVKAIGTSFGIEVE